MKTVFFKQRQLYVCLEQRIDTLGIAMALIYFNALRGVGGINSRWCETNQLYRL